MNDKGIHDECGVFGISLDRQDDVARYAYYAAFALQHRGQEAAGIAVNNHGIITGHKDVGIVNDVFTKDVLDALGHGNMAISHCLYGKKIFANRANAQPMMINHVKGSMAIAMNGAIVNVSELRNELELRGGIFHSLSEAEVVAAQITHRRIASASIEEAVLRAMPDFKGAYSMVVMSPQKLIGVRDPLGIRPLCLGAIDGGYIIASESCAIVAIGGSFLRDIEPGEVVVIENGKITSHKQHCNNEKKALCCFEYIYFARPDSVVDGVGIHEVRMRFGALLAKAHPVEADIVVGVPDSGVNAAMGYAEASGIPYGIGFLKNKYIGRSFIAPTTEQRENLVRIKLNAIQSTIQGKRVVVVDDSIVRGITSARFIRLLREAGATEIHVRSSAPEFINACYYGTDIDSPETLISKNYRPEQIAELIGADSVAFLPVEDVLKAVGTGCKGLCDACFTNNYPIDPTLAMQPMAERIARPLGE